MPKYWNWWGTDPMPEVAEFYYPLAKKVEDSLPDTVWDSKRPVGIASGRYWDDVSFFHIGYDSPRDVSIFFGKDNDGYYVGIKSLESDYEKDLSDCRAVYYWKCYVPQPMFFDTTFATNVLTTFACGKRGWRKSIRSFVNESIAEFKRSSSAD